MKDKNLITNKMLPIHSRQRQRTMLVGIIRLLFCAHLVNLNGQNNSSLIKPMIGAEPLQEWTNQATTMTEN